MGEIRGAFLVERDFKAGTITVKLRTNRKRRKISGHRFVSLIGESRYGHPIKTGLETFGFWKVEENEYMTAGKICEPFLLDAVCHPGYKTYTYEEYEGDCFDDPDFSGLIDAYDPATDVIWEAKTYNGWKPSVRAYSWQLAFYRELFRGSHKPDAWIVMLKVRAKEVVENAAKGINPDVSKIERVRLGDWYRNNVRAKMTEAKAALDSLVATDSDGVITLISPMTDRTSADVKELESKAESWGLAKVGDLESLKSFSFPDAV